MSQPTASELNTKFAILDHLRFEDAPGELKRILIKTPAAEATIYTQGAHITKWNPTGQHPGLYLSPKSAMERGKPIRGGVPIIFPWFGARSDGKDGPMHGFARLSEWTVESTHFSPDGEAVVTMSLEANEAIRAYGFDHFRVAIAFHIGHELKMTLEVTNHGSAPFVFEEGFHPYFAIGDIAQIATAGLAGTTYLDKRDDFKRKLQTAELLHYTRDIDQVHVNTTTPLTIEDSAWNRDLHIEKHGSHATVTWNPGSLLTASMADLDPESYKHFVCVETMNVGENHVTLAPGATHRMDSNVTIRPRG